MDPRVERTRARACATTLDLLMEGGASAVTFEGVAARSGVAKTTLYRHWSSPTALVVDALAHLRFPSPPAPTGDLDTDLRNVARHLAATLREDRFSYVLPALIDLAERDPDVAALHESWTASRRQPVLDLLRAAQERDALAAGTDIEVVVDLLAGPLMYRRLVSHAPFDDAFVDRLVDVILTDLRAHGRG